MAPRAAFQRALQRRKERAQKRGIALIMVLGAITILTVFLTELQTDTTSSVAGALAERDRLKAEYYARSAVNLSRLLLASEKPIRNNPAVALMLQLIAPTGKPPQIPIWEFSDMVLGAFNGGDRATQFGSKVGVDVSSAKNLGIPGNGYFNVVIVDEDSKVNVNSAAAAVQPVQLMVRLQTMFLQPQYAELFQSRDADNQFTDASTFCGAIIDWADTDETLTTCDLAALASGTPSNGSEDNVYQQLGLGYRRKNAPYDSVDELRLIRGMDDERWATFVDPDPTDPHSRLLTVWGQEGINVNTASAQTLLTTVCSVAAEDTPLCIDPLQAGLFLQVVGMVRTFAKGAPLFPRGSDFRKAMEGKGMIGTLLASVGLPPVAWHPTRGSKAGLRNAFKTESKVFTISAEGVVPGVQREARVHVTAVVDMRAATPYPPPAAAPPDSAPSTPASDAAADVAEDQASQNELKTNPFGSFVYYRVD